MLTLQGSILEQVGVSVQLLFFIQLIQSTIIFLIATFVGLFLAPKVNLRLPVLEALTTGQNYKEELRKVLMTSIVWGIIVAIAIYFSDFTFSWIGAQISTSRNLAPVWQTLLASYYGGITEEIVMRLFSMTLFAWILMKITRRNQPNALIMIIAIVISAVFFGLGHLPITAALTTITPLVVTRAIVLNGIGGIIFGWLYWKKGLESAIIAHFTADIFLLTVLPLVFS